MDIFSSKRLAELYWYWRRLPRAEKFPLKRDLDPAAMPLSLLPMVYTVTSEGNPRRFRFGLVGTGTYRFTGRDETNRYVSEEIYGDNLVDMLQAQTLTFESGLPTWGLIDVPGQGSEAGPLLTIEAITLPMSNSGEQVDLTLGAVDIFSSRPLTVAFPTGFLPHTRWKMRVPTRPIDESLLRDVDPARATGVRP